MKIKLLTSTIAFTVSILFWGQIFIPTARAASGYEGTLIISVWGGSTEEWFRKSPAQKFKKLYPNVKVIYDLGGMSARYNKLLAQKKTKGFPLLISC